MDPELIAALAFFGGIVLIPLVYMLLKHQRAMAEIIHRNSNGLTDQRIAMLEQEVRELRQVNYERIIREDDIREIHQSSR